ncbi:MAG TPA: hypothetical protein VH353_07950 [Caulobacteraceae bacterium]|nr:hypothetical protein [Caulobacteraceae bacterium]
MTASSGLRARRDGQGGKPAETALSWAAVVEAWALALIRSVR